MSLITSKPSDAGGGPAATYFSCAAKKSTQKKAAQVSRLLDEEVTLRCLSWQGGCGTRPGEAHKTRFTAGLEQSSPTPPCQAELLGETHGGIYKQAARLAR